MNEPIYMIIFCLIRLITLKITSFITPTLLIRVHRLHKTVEMQEHVSFMAESKSKDIRVFKSSFWKTDFLYTITKLYFSKLRVNTNSIG